jgi:hypothetical protein
VTLATIISVYNGNGFVGRCDAKCHEAKGDDCNCICGGAFHGVGSRIALEDRFTLSEDEIETPGPGEKRVFYLPQEENLFDLKKS